MIQSKPHTVARLSDSVLDYPTGRALYAALFHPALVRGIDVREIDPELRPWWNAALGAHAKDGGLATANELACAFEEATLGLRKKLLSTVEMFRTYGETHITDRELRLACRAVTEMSLVSDLATLGHEVAKRADATGQDLATVLREEVNDRIAPLEELGGRESSSRIPLANGDGLTLDTAEPFEPMPTGLLPEPMQALVRDVSKSLGCDASFVALPAIITASACVGSGVAVEAKRNWHVRPILFGGAVGGPGSGKSPATDAATAPAQCIDAELRAAGAKAAAAYDMLDKEEKAAADPPYRPRMHAKDCTLEALQDVLRDSPAGVIVNPGELSGWFSGMTRYKGASDLPYWLDMHDGRSLTLDRVTRGSFHIDRAAAWVTGAIQPGILPRVIGTEEFASGLAGRLLLVYPPEHVAGWTDEEIPDETVADWEAFCRTLAVLRLHGTDRVLRLDDAARKAFARYVDRNAELIRAQRHPALAAAAAKTKDLPLRLVPALAYGDLLAGEDLVGIRLPTVETMQGVYGVERVEADVIHRAIQLATWLRDESMRVARAIVGVTLEEAEQTSEDALVAFIEARGVASVRDVYTYFRPLKGSSTQAKTALDALVGAGRLERIPHPRSPHYQVRGAE